ncbi:inositol 2-dehydrogenase [Paenibacillus sp. GYB003]|uniref:inositol 2-dehydrogenase n=1 Tax=Paenibacillus sp. GYB003 TaxID=2994392 RepID=UPI002F9651B7
MTHLTIGIIGAGRIGKIHADNLLRLPAVRVAAVSDIDAGPELRSWAAARGIGRVCGSGDDVVSDPAIDAVFICSPTDTHAPLIKLAAASGKHIFCEKPVSMNIARTSEAVEAARQAGVRLQVGFNRRFDRNFMRVRDHVRGGTVGEPHIVKITSRDPGPPPERYVKSSGGMFMDMLIHDFDMARFVTGCEVEEVFAQGGVLIDPMFAAHGDVDTAIVTLRFAGGALGVIDASRRAAYGYDQRLEVFGSKGSVTVGNDYPNTAEVSTAAGVSRDKPLHFFLERYMAAYAEEARQFVDGLLRGDPLPVDGDDALRAEAIALAAARSVRLGRPVKVAEAVAAETAGQQGGRQP